MLPLDIFFVLFFFNLLDFNGNPLIMVGVVDLAVRLYRESEGKLVSRPRRRSDRSIGKPWYVGRWNLSCSARTIDVRIDACHSCGCRGRTLFAGSAVEVGVEITAGDAASVALAFAILACVTAAAAVVRAVGFFDGLGCWRVDADQ